MYLGLSTIWADSSGESKAQEEIAKEEETENECLKLAISQLREAFAKTSQNPDEDRTPNVRKKDAGIDRENNDDRRQFDWQVNKHMSDACLGRFLLARNLDVQQAKTLLREHLEWREKWKPWAITRDDVKIPLNSGSWAICGYSSLEDNGIRIIGEQTENPLSCPSGICGAGSFHSADKDTDYEVAEGFVPILLVRADYWNPHEYESCDDVVRYCAFFMELLGRLGAADGLSKSEMAPQFRSENSHTKGIAVFDLSGWQYWHGNYMKYSITLLNTAVYHYPERVLKLCLCNAPMLFRITFENVLIPLLPKKLAGKIEFFDNLLLDEDGVPSYERTKLFSMLGGETRALEILPHSLGGLVRNDEYPVPNIPGEPNVKHFDFQISRGSSAPVRPGFLPPEPTEDISTDDMDDDFMSVGSTESN